MHKIQNILSGGVNFSQKDEYDQFRVRLLFAILFFSAFSSVFFIAADYFSINPMADKHLLVIKIHLASVFISVTLLYNHKERFLVVGVPYAVLCFGVFVSAMLYVPDDEIRILWFFLNIPAIYILLGQAAGIFVTILSVIAILTVNGFLTEPYSPNAIATSMVGLIYISAFFYAYTSKSISYYLRMKQSNEQLIEIATKDPLTGILNARAYYQFCDSLILSMRRDGISSSVLFIDLDHFKNVNDKYGHEAGDAVLKSVADCLSESKRSSDILGRIGGEEFSILLPSTDTEGAVIIAEKIRKNIEELHPNIGNDTRLKITASIGIAQNCGSSEQMNTIQANADKAMYVAKAKGRNRVTCFEESLTQDAS